jgi:fatty acid desaturase
MATLAPIAEIGDKRSDVPFPHGYRPPKRFLLRIGRYNRTKLVRSAAIALADYAVLIGVPIMAVMLRLRQPAAIVAFVLLAWLAAGRALRGLECLTHEASHYNISRSHNLNDAIGNVFAAIPTFQFVNQFRSGHIPKHHQQFGTSFDPDLRRYDELDLHSIDRSTAWRFTKDIASRLPRYIGGWFRNTGTDARTIAAAASWHMIFYIAPLAVVVGFVRAVELWAVFFAVPFLSILPVIRLIGEAGEHVYRGSVTVFEATVSNVGVIHSALIHPHGDGFHLVHHLWPSVPHHQLKALHQTLIDADPAGFATSRQRYSVIEEPPHPDQHENVSPNNPRNSEC